MSNIISVIIFLLSILFVKDINLKICLIGSSFAYISINGKINYLIVLLTSILLINFNTDFGIIFLLLVLIISLSIVLIENKKFKDILLIINFILSLYFLISRITNYEKEIWYILFFISFYFVLYICYKFNKYDLLELTLAILAFINTFEIVLFKVNLHTLVFIYFVYQFTINGKITNKIIYILFVFVYNYLVLEIANFNLLILISVLTYLPIYISYILSLSIILSGYILFHFITSDFITYMVSLYFVLLVYFLSAKSNNKNFNLNEYNTFEDITNRILSISQVINDIENGFMEDKHYFNNVNDVVLNTYKSFCLQCNYYNECLNIKNKCAYIYLKNCVEEVIVGSEKCKNYDALIKKINRLKGTYLLDINNKKDYKLVNNLSNLSAILNQIAVEIVKKDDNIINDINDLKQNLEANNLNVLYINNDFVNDNSFQITLTIKNTSFESFIKIFEKCKIKFRGYDLKILFVNEEKNRLTVRIVPKSKMNITFGYGLLSSNISNICGDNYLAKVYNDTKFAAVICDGMGKGINAYANSSKIIKIIDSMVSKNLDAEVTLNLINIIYNTITINEFFSSIDLLEINRLNGKGIFYKLGAASSIYISKTGDVNYIDNNNLPVGANNLITPIELDLKDGDLIIMVSDGIYDIIDDREKFVSKIKSMYEEDPQKIVYTLINDIRKNYKELKDDISIIIIKINDEL